MCGSKGEGFGRLYEGSGHDADEGDAEISCAHVVLCTVIFLERGALGS